MVSCNRATREVKMAHRAISGFFKVPERFEEVFGFMEVPFEGTVCSVPKEDKVVVHLTADGGATVLSSPSLSFWFHYELPRSLQPGFKLDSKS